jgi:homogentisate solanesyltransferase
MTTNVTTSRLHYEKQRRVGLCIPWWLPVLLWTTIVSLSPNEVHGFASPSSTTSNSDTVHRLSRHRHQQRSTGTCRTYPPSHPHVDYDRYSSSRSIASTNVRTSASSSATAVSSTGTSTADDSGGVENYSKMKHSSSTTSTSSSITRNLLALYKFTRPHTIRGTILASICGTIRALRDTPHWWNMMTASTATTAATAATTATATASTSAVTATIYILQQMLPRAFLGMAALLFGNAFIVGINQIYDQSIDKVNKPFLPIVSGEMTTVTAWAIVIGSGIMGPILVYHYFPSILFQLYTFGLFLGFIYSVPPIRTKQNPILAGLTIACVRGLLLNFGIYYAVKDTFVRNSFVWSPHVSFIARFMTTFATIIAITKDLPDVEGDQANQIVTFVTKYGIANIAKGATGLLMCNYVHAVITGIVQRTIFAPIPMIGGHAVLAAILSYRYWQLQPNSMASVKRFYKYIWDLFYLEYVLYTLI